MSTATTHAEEVHVHAHDHDHEHHHKDTFITKYIFSIDHKMIAKQYLISGIIMGIIGVIMSLLFRMQIAWPEQPFKIFKSLYIIIKFLLFFKSRVVIVLLFKQQPIIFGYFSEHKKSILI